MLRFTRIPLTAFFAVFCLLTIIGFPQGGLPQVYADSLPLNDSLEDARKRYQEAQFFYNQLRSSGNTSRTQWERGARNFRIIYLTHPRSELAAPSLFMLGDMHGDMYKIFRNSRELKNSISYYKDILRLFPKAKLADDACFNLALIALNHEKSPKKAVQYLKQITTNYQGGNTSVRAEKMLQQLAASHHIPLNREIMKPVQDKSNISSMLPIRHWSSPDYTRVVLTASSPVTYRKKLLPRTEGGPSKLIIELDNTAIKSNYRKEITVGNSLLRKIYTRQIDADTVQVTLDIESPDTYKIFSLPDPFRVVIDIRGAGDSKGYSPKPILTGKKREKQGDADGMVVLEVDDITTDKKQAHNAEDGASLTELLDLLNKKGKEKIEKREEAKVKVEELVILKDRKKIWIQRQPTKPLKEEEREEAQEDTKKEGGGIIAAKTAGQSETQESAKAEERAKKSSIKKDRKGDIPLRQQLGLGVRKIVIDPGHGGKDPGAMGFGLKEKHIVLKLAKELAPIVEKKIGCKVSLTRSTDVFIGLEERTAIANAEKADLFISLHVNAHPLANVRGMETYSLNLSTNAEAKRVAAMENATSTHQISDLENILQDILKNSFASESAKLAAKVQQSIVGVKGHGVIKNLGVKQAPFYVLMNAQMPAILIETSFITNEKDAENLNNDDFLKKLAEKICNGIKVYVDSLAEN